jgi:hypothetical protein
MSDREDVVSLVNTWRAIIQGDKKSWVLFENGTCLILMEPQDNLATQATEIMTEWGPVCAGSSSGDFSVVDLANYPGWVVTGHHPDMLNYVSPDEVEEDGSADFVIGFIGRSKRDEDANTLKIIHIEDKR